MNPPLGLEEEENTIAVTNLELYFSVFKITEQNNKVTIYTPGDSQCPDTIKK